MSEEDKANTAYHEAGHAIISRLMPEHDPVHKVTICLLYTSDAADERSSVDLGGRRIIKKKNIE